MKLVTGTTSSYEAIVDTRNDQRNSTRQSGGKGDGSMTDMVDTGSDFIRDLGDAAELRAFLS